MISISGLIRPDTSGFGRVPDPPEPPSDEWYERHCPRCKYNFEYAENGKWRADCKCPYGCEFKEADDDEECGCGES